MKTLNNTNNLSEEVIRIKLQLLKFEFNAEFEEFPGRSDSENKVYIAKQTFKIDPKSLGQFAPAIKEMSAAVTAMHDSTGKKIVIEYSYKHPSGSNGYQVVLTNNTDSMRWWVDRSF
jgi:hypothetical protein